MFDLICPLDSKCLIESQSGFVCENGHSFDKSKSGYVNLLPCQFKKSLNPGDNKQMVQARVDFLKTGIYDCILQGVCSACEMIKKDEISFIDAGCGDGYYTNGVFNFLKDKNVSAFGFDISKEAVAKASKINKNIMWAVASNTHIPVQNGSCDMLFSLFGFPVYDEFRRVLTNSGLLIMANAGDNHLIEIRENLYTKITQKTQKESTVLSYFDLKNTILVQKTINIDGVALENLIKMTPHFYRCDKKLYQKMMKNPPKSITIDVKIDVFQPK